MDAFEEAVLEFIKGDSKPKLIEIEEELEGESRDEVDGKIDPECAKTRINSGWFGLQSGLRMNPDRTSEALCLKAGCSKQCLESHGLYIFTYKPTGEFYIGKAEKQSLQERIVQHLTKAMSNRELTGNVDRLLRMKPEASNWDLKIFPMPKDKVADTEACYIRVLQPRLNVQQPHI